MPLRPVMRRSWEGVTRWNVGVPARLERVRAAQSIGEWPGARRTLARGLGVELGVRVVVRRCWLLDGGPRLGRGPLDGTRREADVLGGVRLLAVEGRAGGGIRLDLGGLGGGGMFEARCALSEAGKRGVGEVVGCSRFVRAGSWAPSPLSREKVGTPVFRFVGFAFGVVSGFAFGVVSASVSSDVTIDGALR